MKTAIVLLLSVTGLAGKVKAQEESPVHWSYQAKQLDKSTFEVRVTASLDNGWHIYSQIQPEEAIGMPTSFSFISNPLVLLQGKVKEEGKLIHYRNDAVGISQNQYDERVSFMQIVKLRGDVTTAISGTVHFQVCTDRMCLPPTDLPFSIALNGRTAGTN